MEAGLFGDQLVADVLLLFTSPKILFFKETCNLAFLEDSLLPGLCDCISRQG